MSPRTILGIESSCDETAAAVVRDGREVLSTVVYSQVAEHARWGGVVPEIAGRSHLTRIVPVVEEALAMAQLPGGRPDAIAVTCRPGLLGSLLIGTTAAKALALAWNLPLTGVHHVQAHAYAALMSTPTWEFPYITLTVSGGHTSLCRTDSPLDHIELGATLDDAAGEALDKGATMLGLGYPGGPAIERFALGLEPDRDHFKLPLLAKDSLDFSFSGLKTALLYTLKGPGGKRDQANLIPEDALPGLAASFEFAVVETLARKAMRAVHQEGIPRILVGGGVACNQRLRKRLQHHASQEGVLVHIAEPAYCTDNAVMIAGLGHAQLAAGFQDDLDLDAQPRG